MKKQAVHLCLDLFTFLPHPSPNIRRETVNTLSSSCKAVQICNLFCFLLLSCFILFQYAINTPASPVRLLISDFFFSRRRSETRAKQNINIQFLYLVSFPSVAFFTVTFFFFHKPIPPDPIHPPCAHLPSTHTTPILASALPFAFLSLLHLHQNCSGINFIHHLSPLLSLSRAVLETSHPSRYCCCHCCHFLSIAISNCAAFSRARWTHASSKIASSACRGPALSLRICEFFFFSRSFPCS